MHSSQGLILASSSPYRQALLKRLTEDFVTRSPDVDETAKPGESAETLAKRLARAKALAVCEMLDIRHAADSGAVAPVVIGSDQVGALGTRHLGKPGTAADARAQLLSLSGNEVSFYTAVYLVDAVSMQHCESVVLTTCQLRKLSETEIDRYIARDKPLNCAGSFKVEAAGIGLFESVSSNDPTALEGLPLIAVCEGLRSFGIHLV